MVACVVAASGMLGWAGEAGAAGSGPGRARVSLVDRDSGLERVRDRLVELVLGDRVRIAEVELGSLVEEEITLRWAPSGSHGRGSVR